MKRLSFGTYTQYLKMSGLVLALALLVSPAMDVEAKWTRTHASDCITNDGDPWWLGYEVRNVSKTNHMRVYCPIGDTDSFKKQNITTLNVHGESATPAGVAAQTCVTYWYTNGGVCGPYTSASGHQHYTLQPSRIVWNSNHEANFGYLSILIYAGDGIMNNSSFRGYYTEGY